MRAGNGNMPRTTPHPSTWILSRGRLCATVATLVLLGALLLAGGAHAAALGTEPAGEAPSSAAAAEPAPEASPPPAAEPAPEPSSPVAPVVETVQEAPSPVETVVESAPEVPVIAPVVEAAPEASPPVEPVKEVKEVKEAPAAEPVKEAKEAPAVEPLEEATETSDGKPDLEKGTEIQPSSSAGSAQVAAPVDGPVAAPAPEASSTPNGPLATTFPAISGEGQTTSATGSVPAAALARMIAAQHAENFNRELGGLSRSLADTVGGPVPPGLLSVSAALIDDLSGGASSRVSAPAAAHAGGSSGVSGPIGPPSGSTPNGSFGAAAGGGSGAALSGFPTFAGHLPLGAPLAMRRLRLSFQPWLTAFFVLIPERPG